MQIYGEFEGFPINTCIVWGGNIMTPVMTVQQK